MCGFLFVTADARGIKRRGIFSDAKKDSDFPHLQLVGLYEEAVPTNVIVPEKAAQSYQSSVLYQPYPPQLYQQQPYQQQPYQAPMPYQPAPVPMPYQPVPAPYQPQLPAPYQLQQPQPVPYQPQQQQPALYQPQQQQSVPYSSVQPSMAVPVPQYKQSATQSDGLAANMDSNADNNGLREQSQNDIQSMESIVNDVNAEASL